MSIQTINAAQQLVALAVQHPELPIVPLVSSDVIFEERNGLFAGEWYKAELDHYFVTSDAIYLKSTDDINDVLRSYLGEKGYLESTEEQLVEIAAGLPWVEAIIVYIV